MKYILEESDLKGDLKDYPIEIAQKIFDRALEQSRYVIFDDFYDNLDGAFLWGATIEGFSFWEKIIVNKNFDVFFKKYPKCNDNKTAVTVNEDELRERRKQVNIK